jgi:hypothetical protein
MKNMTSSRTTRTRTTTKTTYVPVATNVYFDGNSYRVRMTRNGQKFSKNFTSKRNAISYRNTLTKV